MRHFEIVLGVAVAATAQAAVAAVATPDSPGRKIVYADQGPSWTPETRANFYVQDQGSRLIPLAWLTALAQPDGAPFLDGALARYGYLPNPSGPAGLPVGFDLAETGQGPVVGMTCSACHSRQIEVGDVTYRIDGGPALADFGAFLVDLDAAVRRVLADDRAFAAFAGRTRGAPARGDVAAWSQAFHVLIQGSLPRDAAWGPGRLDAIAMIYNRLDGLDLGPPPSYLLPDNMAPADAPARAPFLWNAPRQDHTQWGGFAANGNDGLALARSLGEVYGVFGTFHPQAGPRGASPPVADGKAGPGAILDRDYLTANSANVAGIAALEADIDALGPPAWPFALDTTLAAEGKRVFDRPIGEGGCAQCHAQRRGEPRPPVSDTWATTTWDVGTDIRQWQVILRSAKSGNLQGASIPGVAAPLKATDLSLNILKTAVAGTLVELQAARTASSRMPSEAKGSAAVTSKMAGMIGPMSHGQMDAAMRVPNLPGKTKALTSAPAEVPPGTFVYEARVLRGIWAAAPYLHDGSVRSLADLLKPAAARAATFAVGPAYDIDDVGLATTQRAGAFVLTTTGCEARASGNSRCGHDYGTTLPATDKRALLEYLKSL